MKLLGWLLRLLVSIIGTTLRLRVEDESGVLTASRTGTLIFVFWHNRIFLMPYLYRRYWRGRHQRDKVAVLVSASRDGEKLVRVLERFGLRCVRGSSSRRGGQALIELTRLVQDGYDAGITPDGPRGPKYQCRDGALRLAQMTQAQIVPVSWSVRRKLVLRKAWDHFQVPLPFSTGVVRMAAPLTIPAELGDAEREQKRLELETVLRTLCDNEP